MNRRNILQILGAAPVLAATSQLGACSTPDASGPWRQAGNPDTDPRRAALSYAILAPNPHNMQPWIVRLTGSNGIEVSIDRSRLLPATDPFSRQIVMGCGAFLELLALAAPSTGHMARIALWPEGEPGPVLDDRPFARIELVATPGATLDPLASHILTRRTSREAFDTARPVPESAYAALAASIATDAGSPVIMGHAAQAEIDRWRALILEAMRVEYVTPRTLQESIDVMRFGRREAAEKPWGIVLDFPFVEAMHATGLLSQQALADPNSQAWKQGLTSFDASAKSAMGFVWLKSRDNSRTTQLLAGRAHARMNLQATALGLSLQPWSQSLQEYPEMAPLFQRVQAETGARADAPVQMLVRIGYGPQVEPAPRRPLSDYLG
jgi:hypothetical protein